MSQFPQKMNKSPQLRQVAAAMCANLGNVNTGLFYGFIAVVWLQLDDSKSVSSIKIDRFPLLGNYLELPVIGGVISLDNNIWKESLSAVGPVVGCVLGGYLSDLLGRKLTLVLTGAPTTLGWILLAHVSSLLWIFTGVLLTGLGSGMVETASRVYTTECSQPHLRGISASLASFGISLGILLQYCLGSFLSWQTVASISTTVPVLSMLTACLLPESPSWLLSRGRKDACRNSLRRLRANDLESELQDKCDLSNRQDTQGSRKSLVNIFHPVYLKPFVILNIYFLLCQFSGLNMDIIYTGAILRDAGVLVSPSAASKIMVVLRLIFTVASCMIMRNMGRRPLTFISSVGCGISMLSLAFYLFAKENKWLEEAMLPAPSWYPVLMILFLLFTAASTLYSVVPWVMIGELYPTRVRGIASGLTMCFYHLVIHLSFKAYPLLQNHLMLTYAETFLLNGCVSLLGTVFFYICLPETKNRTLHEIEEQFEGDK